MSKAFAGSGKRQLRSVAKSSRGLLRVSPWVRTLATVSSQFLMAGPMAAKSGISSPARKFFFDIAHRVLHPVLFVAAAHVAGGNGEAVVVGKVEVSGIEHRGPAEDAPQDGRLEVVDHDFFGTQPKK